MVHDFAPLVHHASLTGSSLTSASLTGASLTSARLTGCSLTTRRGWRGSG
ncbi:MAG: pentapeptide repeat-containing protein [Phycisphaerae bacterium]